MSHIIGECKNPQTLLEKVRKNYAGVFMNVQSKTGKDPFWKKKGQWITLKMDDETGRTYQMSENTYNKIKDNLRITKISPTEETK